MKRILILMALLPVLVFAGTPLTLKYDSQSGGTVDIPTALHKLNFPAGFELQINGATIGGSNASDVSFGPSWNGVTTISPSKNAIYDYVHLFDTDDDGKVNVLDQGAGIPLTDANGTLLSPIADNSANWNTAYTDRLKWDGGSTGLNASTGRASLGLGTLATQNGTFSGTSSGTNTGDQDLSGYQTKAGTLALAGFGSVTGRLPSLNSPLQSYDAAGTPKIAADFSARYLGDTSGGVVMTWGTPDNIYFFPSASNASVDSDGIFHGIGSSLTALNVAAANVTGRIGNTNLPLGAILNDATNTEAIDLSLPAQVSFYGGALVIDGDGGLTTSQSIAADNFVGTGTAITFPGHLSIASGKTLYASNTLTLLGTDGASLNIGTGAQIKDLAGTPKLSVDANARKLYQPNGTTVAVDWSSAGHVYFMDGLLSFDTGGDMHYYGGGGATWDLDGVELAMGGGTLGASYFKFNGSNSIVGQVNGVDGLFRWNSEDGTQYFNNSGFVGNGSSLTSLNASNISSGTINPARVPILNQNTTGSAASLSVSGQTGLLTVTGLTSTNRAKTVRDAADTILELGGSYTPTGTWTSMPLTTPKITTGINDANGNELFIFTTTASAINELTYANAATGANPTYTVSGGDSNIGETHVMKGTGSFTVKAGTTSGNSQEWKNSSNSVVANMRQDGWIVSQFGMGFPTWYTTGGAQTASSGATVAGVNNGLSVTNGLAVGTTAVFGQSWAGTPASPSQITADQNNYTPTNAYYLRLSSDASRSITGLTFSVAQVSGQTHVIVNVGSQNIVLVNESASSTAANRFHNSTGADITLAADQEVNCWYDAATARWRVTKRGF